MRAGIDLRARVGAAEDAAHADDRQGIAHHGAQGAHHAGGGFEHRAPGEAARFLGMRQALDRLARDRGVGGNHPVDAVPHQRIADIADLVVVQVRRNLQRQRHIALVLVGQALLGGFQRGEQAVQLARALQLAQVLGIRRRDVHRHVARVRIDALEAVEVVVSRALDRGVGVLADIQAQHAALGLPARRLHVGHEGIHAAIVEAHAVDQRIGLRQPEHARTRVAGLGARRDRAHLDKAEAERGKTVDVRAVLVETGRQPHGVREAHAHDGARIGGDGVAKATGQAHALGAHEVVQREMVGILRIHGEQGGAKQGIERVEHGEGARPRPA
ncbi:hypothetical protein D3C87_1355660 [compost metagenome]